MERLKIDVRKVLGLLLSIVVMGEGAFLIWYARPAIIEGIGGILARTVSMAGAGLFVLGLLMFLYWLLKDMSFVKDRKLVAKVLNVLGGIASAALVVIGLSVTMSAREVSFQHGYTFGRAAVAVLGSQLILVSFPALILYMKGREPIKNLVTFLGGVLGSTGLIAFGAIIIGVASPFTADFIKDVGAGKMTLLGLFLIITGGLGLAAWMLIGSKWMEGRKRRILDLLLLALSAAVAIFSIYLSGAASDFKLGDFFVGKKVWMVGIAALLFMIDALAVSAWLVREKALNRRFALQVIGMLSGIVLATGGMVVFGFAGDTTIQGLGKLPHSLILMFGAQMVLLGGMGTLTWVLKDTKYFNFGFRKTALDLMMLMLMSIAVVDGLCALMIAAPTEIQGIGGILQRTMTMFGGVVAGLGLLSLATWTFRENPAMPRLKRIEFLVLLFWALMTIAGLLL
ncbi:MAG: hypothetical protein A4E32_01296 [Methanomassiliicoccales archaeon PtaU1.Bin124]|nr:MAG: hypothetical protein A4E32_01296 [Methanomassiliicoccales archaeon PtaU1.Bin124]